MKNKEIDKLIRDITRAGFMAKSEARRRINEIILEERERIKKVIEGKFTGKHFDFDAFHKDLIEYERGKFNGREQILRELLKVIN